MAIQQGGPSYKNFNDGTMDINVENTEYFIAPHGWTEVTSGGGAVTQGPQNLILTTSAGNDGRAQVSCTAYLLNFGADYIYVNWDNPLIMEFTVARETSAASTDSWIQLKQASTSGDLAADGIGLYINNLSMWGESYGSARAAGNIGITMTSKRPYRVQIRHRPGYGVEYWVNGVLACTNALAADIPSGDSASACYFVITCHNNASTTDIGLVVSGIRVWQLMP